MTQHTNFKTISGETLDYKLIKDVLKKVLYLMILSL
jgi:hypothetical protein